MHYFRTFMGFVIAPFISLPILPIYIHFSPEVSFLIFSDIAGGPSLQDYIELTFTAFIITYIIVLLIGVPSYFIMRHTGRTNFGSYLLFGVFVGTFFALFLGISILPIAIAAYSISLLVVSLFWWIARPDIQHNERISSDISAYEEA